MLGSAPEEPHRSRGRVLVEGLALGHLVPDSDMAIPAMGVAAASGPLLESPMA